MLGLDPDDPGDVKLLAEIGMDRETFERFERDEAAEREADLAHGHHEAGHAVIAHDLGADVVFVTTFDYPPCCVVAKALEGEAGIRQTFAGWLAEREYFIARGGDPRDHHLAGALSDSAKIFEAAKALGIESPRLHELEVETTARIRELWPRVVQLVTALQANAGRIAGEDLAVALGPRRR